MSHRQIEAGLPGWAVVDPERLAHVRRVVTLVTEWADTMGVAAAERGRWLRAAWLHDALRDAPVDELHRLAPGAAGPVELLHGPAAATRAAQDGEDDRGVLDAVRYHSVGWAGWDLTGAALYCADFLEPGRRFDPETRAALTRRFPDAPRDVLREVARWRLQWLIRSGWAIPEATWQFWNDLFGSRP